MFLPSISLNIPVTGHVFDALYVKEKLGSQALFPPPGVLSMGHDPPDHILRFIAELCLEEVIKADPDLEAKNFLLLNKSGLSDKVKNMYYQR